MALITNSPIRKTSAETFTISADFTDLLATSDTVVSCTVSCVDNETKTAYSTGADKVISSTTATVATPIASIKVLAGISGRDYLITFSATTTASDVLTIKGLLQVRD